MRRQGFTLIELLIVIAIAAIIAGAMVPLFNVTREDARQAKASSELDTIKTAAIMLHHDTNSWPPIGQAGSGIVNTAGINNWDGPYIDQWVSDPWDSSYSVSSCAAGATLWIVSGGGNDSIAANCQDTDDQRVLLTPNSSN